jgi:Dyp-type peroxidase family
MQPAEPRLRTGQIQGNVVPGFNTDGQRLIGLDIEDDRRVNGWLGDQLEHVTTLADVGEWRRGDDAPGRTMRRTWLNLGFSYEGLRRIGCSAFAFAAVHDRWFKLGMANVAGSLGDQVPPAWHTAHVLAILGHNDHKRLDEACADFVAQAERRGLRARYVECGRRRTDRCEHFGFRDGISVPTVRGTLDDGAPLAGRRPAGAPLADLYSSSGKLLLWPGQAVFGYPGQSRTSAVEPGETVSGGPPWMLDGSFLVYRKLQQDVDAFHAFAREAASRLSARVGRTVTADHVGAMLIGRWPNGSPLVRHPAKPGAYDAGANDFRYFAATPEHDLSDGRGPAIQVVESPADPWGERCPHVAHIRKVNPRDAPTDLAGEPMTLGLQPIRRGIPYGRPEDAERGLLFLAYTTRIDESFGALSRGWVSQAFAPEPPAGASDAIAGNVDHVELRVDGVSLTVDAPRPFVTTVGGGFYFAPSMATLTSLATCR